MHVCQSAALIKQTDRWDGHTPRMVLPRPERFVLRSRLVSRGLHWLVFGMLSVPGVQPACEDRGICLEATRKAMWTVTRTVNARSAAVSLPAPAVAATVRICAQFPQLRPMRYARLSAVCMCSPRPGHRSLRTQVHAYAQPKTQASAGWPPPLAPWLLVSCQGSAWSDHHSFFNV